MLQAGSSRAVAGRATDGCKAWQPLSWGSSSGRVGFCNHSSQALELSLSGRGTGA